MSTLDFKDFVNCFRLFGNTPTGSEAQLGMSDQLSVLSRSKCALRVAVAVSRRRTTFLHLGCAPTHPFVITATGLGGRSQNIAGTQMFQFDRTAEARAAPIR
jgi:hypothetical protein